MGDRFPLLMIGGLVLLGVLGASLLKGAQRGSFADKLSTYRSEPDGARALYLLASESGLELSRQQKTFEVLEKGKNLVLLGVEFDGAAPHEEDVLGEILDGGTPFDLEEDPERRLHRGLNQLKSAEVSEDEREALLEHVKAGATVLYVPWGHPDDPFLSALGVQLYPAVDQQQLRTLVPPQPTPFTLGVERVEAKVQSRLILKDEALPLLVDDFEEEVIAALVPYGQGRVLVLGAPELAMNQALTRADNAQFWLSCLGVLASSGTAAFDEFHHGFTSERSIAEFARRYGLQFAAAQLLLGVGLWAAALRRFGRPRPPPEDVRVGSTDALFAASRLYREGKHFGFAALLIARGAAQDLAPYAGMNSGAVPSEIATALTARGRADAAQALLALTSEAARAASDADVERVARAAAHARSLLHRRPSSPLSPQPRKTP